MIDTVLSPSPLAGFRGPVVCRRSIGSLTLRGFDAHSADDVLILTFIAPAVQGLPDSLTAPTVCALEERRYRIASQSGEWLVEATSVHVHRDIGRAFYRGVPPRPAPLKKRLFWVVIMALARKRAGKRLLLFLRGK